MTRKWIQMRANKLDIKQFRKSLGLTQEAFSRKFDIPISTVRNWEQGLSVPPDYVCKLLEENEMLKSMIHEGDA